MKKLVLIGLALGLIIGISVGLYLYNMKAKDFANSKANIVTTVDVIYGEFNADEALAATKYVANDKVVQVKGSLKEVVVESDSTTTVILVGTATPEATVTIALETKQPDLASKLVVGSEITVNGQCTGMLDDFVTKKVQMIRGGVIDK